MDYSDGHHRRRALLSLQQQERQKGNTMASQKETLQVVHEYLVARTIAEIILIHTEMAQESPEMLAMLDDPIGANIMEEALTEMLTIVKGMPRTVSGLRQTLEARKRRAHETFTTLLPQGSPLHRLLADLAAMQGE